MTRSTAPVRALLTESLVAWHLAAQVEQSADGAVRITTATQDIRIEPAPAGLPIRWIVAAGGRRRGAVSLVAVLRQVRSFLDPGYVTSRVRIASSEPPAPHFADPSRSSTNPCSGERTS